MNSKKRLIFKIAKSSSNKNLPIHWSCFDTFFMHKINLTPLEKEEKRIKRFFLFTENLDRDFGTLGIEIVKIWLEVDYIQILENLAVLFLWKVADCHVFFWLPCIPKPTWERFFIHNENILNIDNLKLILKPQYKTLKILSNIMMLTLLYDISV